MVIVHPSSLGRVVAAQASEARPGTEPAPPQQDLLGQSCCWMVSHIRPERKVDGPELLAPLVSKWVAIDQVSDQRASETLINLLIPRLCPSPTVSGATEPSTDAAS